MDAQSTFPLFLSEPGAYRPRLVGYFEPAQIILSRGSLEDEECRALQLCALTGLLGSGDYVGSPLQTCLAANSRIGTRDVFYV